MGPVKTSYILLAVMAVAVVLAGCTSSSGDLNTGKVVATVGAPTPVPTELPEETPHPTWTPTPTPVPPTITMSDPTFTVHLNGDQQPVSGDPDQDLQLNPQYATRQDTVKFDIQNTGNFTLTGLSIIYELITPMTAIDSYSGQTVTSYNAQDEKTDIGRLNPGDGRQIDVVSPPYGAMLEVNVTISAKWDNGSMILYQTTLEPNFKSGSSISPANMRQVMSYGSAHN